MTLPVGAYKQTWYVAGWSKILSHNAAAHPSSVVFFHTTWVKCDNVGFAGSYAAASLMKSVTAAFASNAPVPAARFVPTAPRASPGFANWQLSAYPCARSCRSVDHARAAAPYSARYALWVSR